MNIRERLWRNLDKGDMTLLDGDDTAEIINALTALETIALRLELTADEMQAIAQKALDDL